MKSGFGYILNLLLLLALRSCELRLLIFNKISVTQLPIREPSRVGTAYMAIE